MNRLTALVQTGIVLVDDRPGLFKEDRAALPMEQAIGGFYLHYYRYIGPWSSYRRNGVEHRYGCNDRF